MNITELQKTYPHIKFYELKDGSDKEFLSMKKLEDFLDIVKTVGYIETKVGSDEASEMALGSVIRSFCTEKNLYHKNRDKFVKFVEENLTKKLEELTSCKEYILLELYGIDFNVMYKENHAMGKDDYESAIKELDNIYKTFQAELAQEGRSFEEEIKACIMRHKNEYDRAEKKTEKEEIIKQIQLDLKLQYELDPHSDWRAKKTCIKRLLEKGILFDLRL